jgi:hypothetical protein
MLMNFVLDAKFGNGYYSAHEWAIGTALVIGGLISLVVGLALKPRAVTQLGGGVLAPNPVSRSPHTFFCVPMHWAGLIIAVIGVGLIVYDLVKPG